jgi:hypothetical protein
MLFKPHALHGQPRPANRYNVAVRTELDVLRDVSTRLEGAGIPFMLTGSMAMNYYAQPRMTRDIDLVVEFTHDDTARLVAMFSPDYYVDADMIREALDRATLFNIIDTQSVVKVDFVIRKYTDYRLTEFRRRQHVKIDSFETWIVSKEDLILSKLMWGQSSDSAFQQRDVRNLLAGPVDRAYLLEWAPKLGVESLLRSAFGE